MQKVQWSLNQEEFKAFFHNLVIFLAPVALVELTLLSQGQLNIHTYLIAFEVWAIGVSIDFFRKAKAGTPTSTTTTVTQVPPVVTTNTVTTETPVV
jgi:hypothetical protein